MRLSMGVAALWISLGASAWAAPPERAAPAAERAQRLEELGRPAEAARAYQSAFEQTRDPAMLYRLALCRRDLGDYAAAREALRGYLREAPGGPLREEVERQLSQLAVLIEARGLRPPASPKTETRSAKKRAPAAASSAPPPQETSPQPSEQPAPPASHVLPESAPASPSAVDLAAPLPPVSNAVPVTTAARAAPAPPREPPLDAAASGFVSDVHEPLPAAPGAALRAEPAPTIPARARWKRAAPWLGAAALGAAAGGTILCVAAHRGAADLDARFASGDLTAADLPGYSRARAEGIAGTALITAALLAGAAALVLAW